MKDEESKNKDLGKISENLLKKIELTKIMLESRAAIKVHLKFSSDEQAEELKNREYQIKMSKALITMSILKHNDYQISYRMLVDTYPVKSGSNYLSKDELKDLFDEVYTKMDFLRTK